MKENRSLAGQWHLPAISDWGKKHPEDGHKLEAHQGYKGRPSLQRKKKEGKQKSKTAGA